MAQKPVGSAVSACGKWQRLARVGGRGVLLLLLAVPTFSRAAEADKGNAEQELTALEKQWWDSIQKHDRAMLEAVLADDFMGVDNGGEPATTKRQWVDWAMTFPLKSYVIEKLEMRIAADTAIVAVHYSTRVMARGVEKSDHGVDMDIFVRRNGRWQALGTGEVRVIAKK
jgi:Domain of unknown function (DUF4440)